MTRDPEDRSGKGAGIPPEPATHESSLASAVASVAERAEREAAEAEAADFRKQVRLVTEFFKALDRALKVRKLYSPSNDTYRTALVPVNDRLDGYLKDRDELSVIVMSRELRLRDAAVYSSDDRDTSVAFQLYKNGIRRLTFGGETDPDELLQFVEVMEQDRDGKGGFDDDLVTLLWKRDLPNISCRIIDPVFDEGDDLFDGDRDEEREGDGEGRGSRGPGGDAARSLRSEVQEFVDEMSSSLRDRKNLGVAALKGDERIAGSDTPLVGEERSSEDIPLILALDEDEVERLKREVLEDQRTSRFGKFVDILFALLERESEELDLEEAADLIGQMLLNFLERGDFPELNEFMSRVRSLLVIVPPPVREALAPQLSRLGHEEVIGRLPVVLSRGYEGGVEALKQFLNGLGAESTEGLRRLLGELGDDREHRQVVIEVLIRGSERDLSQIARGLHDPDVDVVLATISVLKGVQDRTSLRYLPSALKHRDPKVRIAALDAIRPFSDAKATGALLQGLDDQEAQVRLFALKALRSFNDPRISTRVGQVIDQKGFSDLPAWEQQHYFELLVANRGPGAFEILKGKLTKRSLLGAKKLEPMRCAAARALASLAIPATVELLQSVRDREKGEVSQACAEALRSLAEGTGGRR